MRVDSHSYAYAKAIFDLAVAQKQLLAWEKILLQLSVVVQLREVQVVCASPHLSLSQRANLLIELGELARDIVFPEVVNCLQLLLLRKRIDLLPHITKIYQDMYAAYTQTLRVRVVTVQPLMPQEKQQLITKLEQNYKCTIELKEETNSALIGGLKIYIGDKVIDASVMGQLRKLNKFLIVT